jgi:hypothetical protein
MASFDSVPTIINERLKEVWITTSAHLIEQLCLSMVEPAEVGLETVFEIGRFLRVPKKIDSPEAPDSLKRPGEPPNRPRHFVVNQVSQRRMRSADQVVDGAV